MTKLPEAGIGEEIDVPPTLWERVRTMAHQRMGYALGDQIVYSFGNMVVFALMRRYCSERESGIYILTQRAMDVLIQLSNVFLWGPFMFNLPGMEKLRQRVYMGSIFAQQVTGCVLGALLLWAGSRWASTPERGLYYGVFYPLILTSIGILFREYTRRMYFAEMRMKEAFWTDVATVGLQIAGVEWLYLHHELDVPHTLWVLAWGAILVSLWWLLSEWRTFQLSLAASGKDMLLNLKLGRWFLGSNMVFMVSSQCNPWILGGLLGGASVGDYSVCESVVNIPRVALVSMQNIMAPMMARAYADGGKPALKRMVRRLDEILLGGSALFALGICFAGPWVAGVIYSAHKVPGNSRQVLILLALNLVAYAATMAQSYGLSAMDKAGYPFYANTVGLVVQFAMSFWLVRSFHVSGAAAAMLVGSLVVLVVRQIYYSREIRRTVPAA